MSPCATEVAFVGLKNGAVVRLGLFVAYGTMCAIWGTTWLAIKISLRYIPPFTGVGVRFAIAGLLLFFIGSVAGERYDWRRMPWNAIVVLAVFLFGLNYVLTYVAETRLDSGLVAVLFATTPFFVFAFGRLFIGERTSVRTWIGALVAFAGICTLAGSAQARSSPAFVLAAIASAAMAAFALVYAKKYSGLSPLAVLPPSMLVAGIGVLVLAIPLEHPSTASAALSLPSVASLLYLAIFGSMVAFFLNLWLLRRMEAWRVGLSAMIVPIVAVCVGIVFGGERFTWLELMGSGLVVLGLCGSLTGAPGAEVAAALGSEEAIP